jgi:hypothetical protein
MPEEKLFDVTVFREREVVRVTATDEKSARQKVLEQLEKGTKQPVTIAEVSPVSVQEALEHFEVDICRISYRTVRFKVKATSREDAEQQALRLAENYDFSSKPEDWSRYDVFGVTWRETKKGAKR